MYLSDLIYFTNLISKSNIAEKTWEGNREEKMQKCKENKYIQARNPGKASNEDTDTEFLFA